MLILIIIRPDDLARVPVIVYERHQKVFTKKSSIIVVVCVVTMFSFAFSSYMSSVFGDISIISLVFLVSVFGSGLLSEVCCAQAANFLIVKDFNWVCRWISIHCRGTP
jgi:K+-sensing histidine kinase KdpD